MGFLRQVVQQDALEIGWDIDQLEAVTDLEMAKQPE
jgi:hypothetical protein